MMVSMVPQVESCKRILQARTRARTRASYPPVVGLNRCGIDEQPSALPQVMPQIDPSVLQVLLAHQTQAALGAPTMVPPAVSLPGIFNDRKRPQARQDNHSQQRPDPDDYSDGDGEEENVTLTQAKTKRVPRKRPQEPRDNQKSLKRLRRDNNADDGGDDQSEDDLTASVLVDIIRRGVVGTRRRQHK